MNCGFQFFYVLDAVVTAPSKLDLQPHLGFAPLDLQPHPESATLPRHSSSQRNQIGPYQTNYLLRDYSPNIKGV